MVRIHPVARPYLSLVEGHVAESRFDSGKRSHGEAPPRPRTNAALPIGGIADLGINRTKNAPDTHCGAGVFEGIFITKTPSGVRAPKAPGGRGARPPFDRSRIAVRVTQRTAESKRKNPATRPQGQAMGAKFVGRTLMLSAPRPICGGAVTRVV